MPNLNWSNLTALQLGRYAEYYAKMEFASYAFEVFNSEVDDRGVDFVVKSNKGIFHEIQVKGMYRSRYIFFKKDKFKMNPNYFICLLQFKNSELPAVYLIPSMVWSAPNKLFVSRDYPDKKSNPEWGVSLTKANVPLLMNFTFDNVRGTL